MILTRVRAHPFGCFTDSALSFSAGLNVVLGPNEAGKSTFFQAIRYALCMTTRLAKPERDLHVTPYLPALGGDSISVEVEFTTTDGRWHLERRWGAGAGSRLTLPAGGSLSEEEAVKQRLSDLLPAKPGTVANILMTRQSELSDTKALLADKKRGLPALADLADLMRSAFLDSGGVSVERFRGLLQEQVKDAFDHWDPATGRPERDRGLSNPWKKDVGTILQAWYLAEESRAAWKYAEQCEAEADALNARLRAAAAGTAEREAFVAAHGAAARDARERRTLEAELAASRAEAGALRAVYGEWPVLAETARTLEAEIAAASAARAPLDAELAAARRAEEGRGLRERQARVQRRAAQRDEARKRLAESPRLEKKALEEIRRAFHEREKLEAGAAAGMLSVTVAGRADVDLTVQEDFARETRRRLAAGETVRLKAGGRLRIVHPDMEVEVRSGDADAEARVERTAEAKRAFDELLARHGVASVAEAEERFRVSDALAADEAAARRNLEDELAGETREALDARVAALGPEGQARAAAGIAAELAALAARGEAKARELAQARKRIQDWTDGYGSIEKLLDMLADARARENGCTERLGRAAPLPAGFTDAEGFLQEFEKAQKELADLRVELRGLEERKQALVEKAGDQPSAEELAVVVSDRDEAFQSALRRGRALKRIEAACAESLGQRETTLFDGMREGLDRALSSMTGGRHARVRMDDSVPTAIEDGAGATVQWDMLSAGTKDSLALALRLAMAGYFLKGTDGFLVMDDPLVEMDPDRQEMASTALKAFAADRQLIIFTCHPAAAELLGGNLVRL